MPPLQGGGHRCDGCRVALLQSTSTLQEAAWHACWEWLGRVEIAIGLIIQRSPVGSVPKQRLESIALRLCHKGASESTSTPPKGSTISTLRFLPLLGFPITPE